MPEKHGAVRWPLLLVAAATLGALAVPAAAGTDRVVTASYSNFELGASAMREDVRMGESSVLLEVIDDLGHAAIGSVKVDSAVGEGISRPFCGTTVLVVHPGQTVELVTPIGYFDIPPAGCVQGTMGTLRMTFR